MKQTFKSFVEEDIIKSGLVDEGINDKGKFKAIFITGIPGSGKTYTAKRLAGDIKPVMVNTDRAVEFKAKKLGITSTSALWKTVFRDSALRITEEILFQAVNGMLPLFIDSTSNNPDLIYSRVEVLEKLGYDVGMIFIDTPLDVALKRAKAREEISNRAVNPEYIDQVEKNSERLKEEFASHFDFFVIHKNDEAEELDNTVISGLYTKAQKFFDSPVQNSIGQETLKEMMENGYKTLTPEFMSEGDLHNKLSGWYIK